MTTPMFTLYRGMLALGGLVADDEGLISSVVDGLHAPFTVDHKRLALPTDILTRDRAGELTFFHPLRENVNQGESLVLSRFRRGVNLTLNLKLQDLFSDIFRIIASVELHREMNNRQNRLITVLGSADEKKLETAYNSFDEIQRAMQVDKADQCYVYIQLRRRPKIRDKEHNRGALVNFPLYEEVIRSSKGKTDEEKKIFGVKVSNITRNIIKAVIEFVLPKVGEPDAYSVGSDANMAPFLVALVDAELKINDDVMAFYEEFEPFITHKDRFKRDEGWLTLYQNLGDIYGETLTVPMQPGNDAPRPSTSPAPAPSPVQNNNAYVAPAPAPYAGAPIASDGKVDLLAMINQREMASGYSNNWGGQPSLPPGAQANRMQAPVWANNGPIAGWNSGGNGGGGFNGGGPRI